MIYHSSFSVPRTEQERRPSSASSSPSQRRREPSLKCFSLESEGIKRHRPPPSSSSAPLPPRPRPQTWVVHKGCPVKGLFIVSPCVLSRFSHPPGCLWDRSFGVLRPFSLGFLWFARESTPPPPAVPAGLEAAPVFSAL